MIFQGFIGPTYQSQSPNADAERCCNWILEAMESPFAKSMASFYDAPGVENLISFPTYPNRGLFEMNGRAFAVSGNVLYEFKDDNTFIARGTMATDTNQATIVTNGDAGHQLCVSSGNKAYVLDLNSNAFSHVLDGVTQLGFLDGYVLALDANTSTLKVSDFEDAATWNPVQVAQRNTAADRWVAMGVIHGEIWLFGSQTTEIWYDAGTSPFPFAWLGTQAFNQHGSEATFALSRLERSIVWLSKNEQGQLTCRKSNGYDAEQISNKAIETIWQGYTTTSDADAFSYQENGHTFYQLSFPSANTAYGTGSTWVYDLTTNVWHERPFWNTATGFEEASRRRNHCFAFGNHVVGDRMTGTLYRQSTALFTDVDGNGMRRVRQSPYVNNQEQRVFFPGFTLDVQVGVGSSADPDPKILFQYSDSQAQTWSTLRSASLGTSGAYQQRVRWWPLGMGRSGRIFRVTTTAKAPVRLTQAYLQPDPIAGTN